MKNNEFEKAYYKNCPIHKKKKCYFFVNAGNVK